MIDKTITEIPFVVIPAALEEIVGEPDKGTRMFRQYGTDRECTLWFELLHQIDRQFVSPGGVSMFAGASRAAVHKRLREGRLTAFCFHITRQTQNWFGRVQQVVKKEPYVYIPVSECKAWGQLLERRANEIIWRNGGKVSPEMQKLFESEVEGEKPDWDGWFLNLKKSVKDREKSEKKLRESWRELRTADELERLEESASEGDEGAIEEVERNKKARKQKRGQASEES